MLKGNASKAPRLSFGSKRELQQRISSIKLLVSSAVSYQAERDLSDWESHRKEIEAFNLFRSIWISESVRFAKKLIFLRVANGMLRASRLHGHKQ